ncbi:olfactory receptor 10AG1-like [Dendropsophus ebraccatus]|uniref:olfactory receptor 10AG1-like n=1 Tax=Dendropsophus ebraccatus TaxID=150705 RepID=UPI0038311F67
MEGDIPSNGTMFFFLGFSDLSLTAQASLFMFFFLSYLLSLIGNGLIIVVVTLSPQLQSPMYFFLKVLSFLEVLSITSTAPKALQIFLTLERSIPFAGCAVQFFTFIGAAGCECVLLTVMAFDRYLAICHPLRYMSVMTMSLCYKLTVMSLIFAFGNAIIGCSVLFSLSYCGPHLIAHFFCDIPPMISLACGNTFIVEVYFLIISVIAIVLPTILIICSYTRILISILLLHSEESRYKAFSTCGSHVFSVVIFFGAAMFVHLRLGNPFTPYEDRMTALFYCIVIPTINPLIYSLKNKEMMKAIRKLNLKLVAL